MNEERFPKRKNPRAKSFDYTTPGFYFITICAAVRDQNLFCRLTYNPTVGAASLGGPPEGTLNFAATEPPTVVLTPLGEMVRQHIENINTLYPNTRVDTYTIMPDHVHMIIQLIDLALGPPREAAPTTAPDIIRIINSFKGITARKAGTHLWQRSFYDHIIRSDEDLYNTRNYILGNASKYYLNHTEGLDTHA